MKQTIEFYYNLRIENLHFQNQIYYFNAYGQAFELRVYQRSEEELNQLFELQLEACQQDISYQRVILNRNQQMITWLDHKPYVLLKQNGDYHRLLRLEDLKFLPVYQTRNKQYLVHFPWTTLWMQKIDYIEYQIAHLENEYPILAESLWYFIGLGENAISYVVNTENEVRREAVDHLVVAHRRLKSTDMLADYYNPLTLIIDHPTRDIAEYLKSSFLEGKYDLNEIEAFLNGVALSPYGYRLLFGRLLFPSFYFDCYQRIVEKEIKEEKIYTILNRILEYEVFLGEIYQIIKTYSDIPPVDWITKKM